MTFSVPTRSKHAERLRRAAGSTLLLVLWAVLMLSTAVFAWVNYIHQDVTRLSEINLGLEARALAFSGISMAMHPGVTQESPQLNRNFPGERSYSVQLSGEGGKLNINWLLQGEDPVKLDLLKLFLERRGVKYQDRQIIVDCLLDWIDPDNEKHLNGREAVDDYQPANRPFQNVEEMEQVHGMDLLSKAGSWQEYFTVHSQGPIDLRSASYDLLRTIPGIGDAKARRFVDFRDGKDKRNGTADDFQFRKGLPEAMSYLGLAQQSSQQILPLLSYNDPTYEIVSSGKVGKVNRQLTVVARKDSPSPTILLWKEL